MSNKTDLGDAFTLQIRISVRNNPDLHQRLTSGLIQGETQSSVLRRLAEEALLLRSHPLIAVIQGLDFERLSTQESFISRHGITPNESTKDDKITNNPLTEVPVKKLVPMEKALSGEPFVADLAQPEGVKKTDASGAFANLLVSQGLVR